jgi:hypothetical protein
VAKKYNIHFGDMSMDSSMRIGLTHFGTIDAYRIYTLTR